MSSSFNRGMMMSRPNQRTRQTGAASVDTAGAPGWMSFWSATSFTNKKSAIASAVYTIVFSSIIIGFSSYELYKLDQFWARYREYQSSSYKERKDLFNKDMQPVTEYTITYYIRISGTERGVIAAFMCLCVALIGSSITLIVCTSKEKKELAIPWIVNVVIVGLYGSILVVMDCIVYEFGAENNLQLLIWVSFVFGSVHSLRCVGIYYRHLSGSLRPRGPRPQITTAEFDPRQANDHAIFTTSQSVEPVVIRMTPPPYEKDPPVYTVEPEDVSCHTSTTTLSTTPTEKPPDYSP